MGRSLPSQRRLGKKFQREAAMDKALSPQVWCLVLSGGDRKLASEERRLRKECEGGAAKK